MDRRFWRVPKAGSLRRLRLESGVLEPPSPGQVQVRVRALGLNFADVFSCLGLYSATPRGPFIPGLEFAGEVVERGAGSGREGSFRVGARVFGVCRFGAFATALNVSVDQLQALPAEWHFQQGAAYPAQALTAWYGLVELARLQAQEVVLIHSAAGGVGLHAVQIAQRLGAHVLATVGRPEKVDFLVERTGLQPGQVIVRNRRRFERQLAGALRSSPKEGLDVVLDALLGPYFRPAWRHLRPRGRHVVYGAAHFMTQGARPRYLKLALRYLLRPRLDPLFLISENRSLMGFNLIWLWEDLSYLQQVFGRMWSLHRQPPWVGKVFPFERLPEALRFLQSGRSVGKVVVEVD